MLQVIRVALTGLVVAIGFFPSLTEAPSPQVLLESEKVRGQNVEILFVGDMMFDRSMREVIDAQGIDFIFSCVAETLRSADLVVANLEGPITPYKSLSVGSSVGGANNTTFTFAPEVAPALLRHNIQIVSFANNHSRDFGPDGVEQTKSILSGARVGYFGAPYEEEDYRKVINGVPLSFIGYNQFGGDETITFSRIQSAKADGYLPIVFSHWGNEYVPASKQQQELAHRFIDAGAEMVVGAHPHVIQGSEEYNGKKIYYSLGNFIFDQYFEEAVRNGLLLRVVITPEGVISAVEEKVYLERDRRTCPIP